MHLFCVYFIIKVGERLNYCFNNNLQIFGTNSKPDCLLTRVGKSYCQGSTDRMQKYKYSE